MCFLYIVWLIIYHWNMWINLKKYSMNKNLSKKLIKHCNACFSTVKIFINTFQNCWKLHIFWNILHKPWHNNFKILEDLKKSMIRNIPPKACRCSSHYLVCTKTYLKLSKFLVLCQDFQLEGKVLALSSFKDVSPFEIQQ